MDTLYLLGDTREEIMSGKAMRFMEICSNAVKENTNNAIVLIQSGYKLRKLPITVYGTSLFYNETDDLDESTENTFTIFL